MSIPFQARKQNNWYYVSSETALEQLQRHAKEISNLVPFWYGITDEGTLVNQSQAEAIITARQNNLPILAIIHNYADPAMGDLIHDVLTTPQLRSNLVNSIEQLLVSEGFKGVNIDFEFIPPEDRQALNTFMSELYRRLSPRFKVTISVPAQIRDNPEHPFSGAFDYNTLSMVSDEIFVLAYDEHFAIPGPIASIGFVRQVLDYAVTQIPPSKIKLGMPVYGYEWLEDGGLPRTLSYSQAINLAQRKGVNIIYDETAQEPMFTYTQNQTRHIVWFEDARSFSAKLDLVFEYNLGGIAVWRLGQEDPLIWSVIRNRLM